MTDRNDYSTTVLRGKGIPAKRGTSNPNAQLRDTHSVDKPNASVLERDIDSGKKTLPPKIGIAIAREVQQLRAAKKIGDKTMTQSDLAQRANQSGGKGITPTDISNIEMGSFLMTTENKVKLNAVRNALAKTY